MGSFLPGGLKFYTAMYMHACVINNGYSKNYFLLAKGSGRGDLISAHLFIFAVELLALNYKQYKTV